MGFPLFFGALVGGKKVSWRNELEEITRSLLSLSAFKSN